MYEVCLLILFLNFPSGLPAISLKPHKCRGISLETRNRWCFFTSLVIACGQFPKAFCSKALDILQLHQSVPVVPPSLTCKFQALAKTRLKQQECLFKPVLLTPNTPSNRGKKHPCCYQRCGQGRDPG